MQYTAVMKSKEVTVTDTQDNSTTIPDAQDEGRGIQAAISLRTHLFNPTRAHQRINVLVQEPAH